MFSVWPKSAFTNSFQINSNFLLIFSQVFKNVASRNSTLGRARNHWFLDLTVVLDHQQMKAKNSFRQNIVSVHHNNILHQRLQQDINLMSWSGVADLPLRDNFSRSMLSNQLDGVSEEEIQSNIGKYGSPSGKGEISKWRQLNEKIQYRVARDLSFYENRWNLKFSLKHHLMHHYKIF